MVTALIAACEINMHCPPSKLRLKFHRTTISVISSHTKSLQYLPMAWKNWTRRFWKRPIYHSKIKSYRTCATHKCWQNSNDFMAFGDQKISKILGALLLEISKTKRWVKYSRLRDEGNHHGKIESSLIFSKNWIPLYQSIIIIIHYLYDRFMEFAANFPLNSLNLHSSVWSLIGATSKLHLWGTSLLLKAVEKGNVAMAELLLSAGAVVDVLDSYGAGHPGEL